MKRSEFLRLVSSGQAFHSRYFVLNAHPGVTDRTRLGITVTRKVGGAVIRNRMKRLSREYFRLHRTDIVGVWDLNVVVKKPAADLETQAFFSQLRYVFNKLRPDRR